MAFVLGAVIGVRSGGFDGLITQTSSSSEALDAIEDSYFRSVDPEDLQGASVSGMVRYLQRRYEDRFTRYFDPEQYSQFQESTSGEFSGVGMTVSEIRRGLRVARTFPGSPAKRAGIERGDVITRVDGRSIAGVSSAVATARIKGPEGSTVRLTVVSPSGNARQLKLTREAIALPVVAGRIVRVGGVPIAYVRMVSFTSGVHGLLRSEVEKLYRKGAEGLVLDLRGNGGGLLSEAVLASSVFVENGRIVSTAGRTDGRRAFDAQGDAIRPKPMAVLVDRDTASAAEIMASALEQAGVATTVGERTFGKGTFQRVIPLGNGGALDLTLGEYLTRDGTSVNGKGLKPEIVVTSGRDFDRQLRRALAIVRREIERG